MSLSFSFFVVFDICSLLYLVILCRIKWDRNSFLNQWENLESGGHGQWSLMCTFLYCGHTLYNMCIVFESTMRKYQPCRVLCKTWILRWQSKRMNLLICDMPICWISMLLLKELHFTPWLRRSQISANSLSWRFQATLKLKFSVTNSNCLAQYWLWTTV